MKNMFFNYDNPTQQPEKEVGSCNKPLILSTSDNTTSLLKNVKEEVIGIQVKHASTFNFEVQLNECDLLYTQGSILKVELYTLNNKSVFKKEFETATIFNADTNKLNLTFSQEESKTLNKESYKMSLKLCKENDFIEIFAPTDGFLIIR